MSVLTKSLHPDEKVKAGKLGATLIEGWPRHRRRLPRPLDPPHHLRHRERRPRQQVGAVLLRLRDRLELHLSHRVGTLWLVILHHLCAAAGPPSVRRIAEAMTERVPDRVHRRPRVHHPDASPATRTSTTGRTRTRANAGAQPRPCCTSSAGCRPTFFSVRYVHLRRDLQRLAVLLREEVAQAGRDRRSEAVGADARRVGPGDDPATR